ncbi:MAG: Yip1 family protein [Thermoanaerobaculia bacterium]
MAGALFAPVKTFESIAQRPTWLAPLILWTVVSIVVTAIVLPKMDFERMARQQMEKSGQTISEERLQEIAQQQKKIGGAIAYVFAGATPAILALLVAVIFWGSLKAFGWDSTFRQAFGVTAHAFLPGIVGALLLVPVLQAHESVDPRGIGDLLRSNLGFLVERDMSKVLHSLLASVDVFSFWSLGLFVVGFAAAANVSRKQSASVILTLWFLFVLGKAGVAALGFGG